VDLADARARVRFFVNEPSAAQWTDAKLNNLIVAANREIYSDICARTVDYFYKRVRVTYPGNSVSIELNDTDDQSTAGPVLKVGRWTRVIGLFELDEQADPSPTNGASVMPVAEDIIELYQGSVTGPAEDPWTQIAGGSRQWKLYGRNLFVYPMSSTDLFLWIHMVPVVFDPIADANQLLSLDSGTTGELLEHHDIIPMLAAIDILVNVGEDSTDLRSRYVRKFQTLVDTLGLQQQSQAPSRVTNQHG